jgi:hypothetical protein
VQAADVDEDGVKDLVAGSRSGGVWALDGASLDDHPGVLWRTDVGTAVHEVHVADLDGDGQHEVIAAATRGIEVLRLSDGERKYRVPYPAEDLVWTVTIADVDEDGTLDLVVPTRTIGAYRGSSGSPLWTFAPTEPNFRFSTTAVTPDGVVVAQGMADMPGAVQSRHYRVAVGLEAATGAAKWATPQVGYQGAARLWHTVAAGPAVSTGGTEVALTWERPVSPVPGSLDRAVVDVVDSASGQVLYTSGPLSGSLITQETRHWPGFGFVQQDRVNIAVVGPAGVQQTEFPSFVDVELADLGAEMLLGTYRFLEAFPADTLTGAQGGFAVSTARWKDLEAGAMHVQDLDGDGVDEVVTMHFDWPAFVTVSAFADFGATPASPVLHTGLSVLEAA